MNTIIGRTGSNGIEWNLTERNSGLEPQIVVSIQFYIHSSIVNISAVSSSYLHLGSVVDQV